MQIEKIEAIGLFLNTYRKNLSYIKYFREFRNGGSASNYLDPKNRYSFVTFLRDFKVARSINAREYNKVLRSTDSYLNKNHIVDINEFAEILKSANLTHGDLCISLASKILFLADPIELTPYDKLAKKALGIKSNIYTQFQAAFIEYRDSYKSELKGLLKKYETETAALESGLGFNKNELSLIKLNRITDKMLWVRGSNMK